MSERERERRSAREREIKRESQWADNLEGLKTDALKLVVHEPLN